MNVVRRRRGGHAPSTQGCRRSYCGSLPRWCVCVCVFVCSCILRPALCSILPQHPAALLTCLHVPPHSHPGGLLPAQIRTPLQGAPGRADPAAGRGQAASGWGLGGAVGVLPWVGGWVGGWVEECRTLHAACPRWGQGACQRSCTWLPSRLHQKTLKNSAGRSVQVAQELAAAMHLNCLPSLSKAPGSVAVLHACASHSNSHCSCGWLSWAGGPLEAKGPCLPRVPAR